MKIPSQLTAGDSATWLDDPTTDNLGNAIDSSWTLKFAFQQAGVPNLIVTAAASGVGWSTTISKTQSALWKAGVPVYWQAYAEKSSDRVTIGSGQLRVIPNISSADQSSDLRSKAQQRLDAVEAAIDAIMTGGAVAEYSIGGRSLRKMSMPDLLMWRDRLKAEVAAEKKAQDVANGLGNPSNVFVRFGKGN